MNDIEKEVKKTVDDICEKYNRCTVAEGGGLAKDIYQALRRAEKRGQNKGYLDGCADNNEETAREAYEKGRVARDKEIMEKMQWCKEDGIGSSNTLYEIKKFINQEK